MSDTDADSQGFKLTAAESLLREIGIPLEIIVNLSYLAAHEIDHRESALQYLRMLDEQAALIGKRVTEYFEAAKADR